MHLAARFGLVPLIDVLVARGAEVDASDVLGTTPLGYAYAYGKIKAVEAFVKYGADEGVRNKIPLTRFESEDDGDSSDVDQYSSDESDDDGGRRGRGGRGQKKKKRTRKKGRLPRECAGLRKRVLGGVGTF